MNRIRVNFFRRALLYQVSLVHNSDVVAEILYDRQVMRNEENRQSELTLQFIQQIQYLRLNGYIQSGDRLVRNNQACSRCPPENS